MTENLPVLADLYDQKQIVQIKKENDLNIILNCEPNPKWIKKHPFGGFKFIQIGVVEYLLTSIFVRWRTEIKETKLVANSILTVVRLHYRHPVTGEFDWVEGLGAAPIQTDKGAGATDFSKVKTDAVMKGAPSSKSIAIKNAAASLGKIFGRDLNRDDEIGYDLLKKKSVDISGIKPIK